MRLALRLRGAGCLRDWRSRRRQASARQPGRHDVTDAARFSGPWIHDLEGRDGAVVSGRGVAETCDASVAVAVEPAMDAGRAARVVLRSHLPAFCCGILADQWHRQDEDARTAEKCLPDLPGDRQSRSWNTARVLFWGVLCHGEASSVALGHAQQAASHKSLTMMAARGLCDGARLLRCGQERSRPTVPYLGRRTINASRGRSSRTSSARRQAP